MITIRKVLAGTTSLFLVCGLYTGIMYARNSAQEGVDPKKTLNLTVTDSTSLKEVSQFSKDVQVDTVIGSQSLYMVMNDNQKGDVHSEQSSSKPDEAQTANTAKVAADVLNVRREANTICEVIGKLKRGQTVNILIRSEDWYKISYNGIEGWVHNNFLSTGNEKGDEKAEPAKKQTVIPTGLAKVTAETLNLRTEASTSAKVIARLKKGAVVKVTSNFGNWCKVSYDGIAGWVHKDFLSFGKMPAANEVPKQQVAIASATIVVTANILNVRSEPNTSAKVVAKLEKGKTVTAVAHSGNWYKIKTAKGITGWASKEYLSLQKTQSSKGSRIASRSAAAARESSKGDNIAAYAKKFLGVPYLWGGTTPKGFDCSGFVYYVYKHFGIKMNRIAAEQARQGRTIKKSELRPGDLMFFDTVGRNNGQITHVGIYIGGGKFIHASNPKSDVKITDVSDSFYSSGYIKSARVIE